MHITKEKHYTAQHIPPSTPQARKEHGSPQMPPSREASSSDSEPEPQEGKRKRQLDLAGYPEVEAELERIQEYYTREVNVLRKGVALRMETWRKLKIHMLSECIMCAHVPVLDSFATPCGQKGNCRLPFYRHSLLEVCGLSGRHAIPGKLLGERHDGSVSQVH